MPNCSALSLSGKADSTLSWWMEEIIPGWTRACSGGMQPFSAEDAKIFSQSLTGSIWNAFRTL